MRVPNRIRSLLLAALLPALVPASASAQAAYSSSGSASSGGASSAGAAQYDGSGNGGGASANGPYYDDGDDENADNGGQEPSGNLPDPPKPPSKPKPAKKPAPPAEPAPAAPEAPPVSTPGTVAQLMSNGKATVPKGAPKSVRQMIVAANRLIGKPYKWGGGHAKVEDKGYDCSGSVSYALIGGGQLLSPLVSGDLAKWGSAGAGAWVTVYANKNHVYMEIAGLRFDTSPIADPSANKGPRWRPLIGARKGFKVRHPVGL